MNTSIIYVYLGIVMLIVLATTFYVRTIKSKLDTKVDAMFQLVQSLVNEVNQLKMGQSGGSKPKEVIELDINSSDKQCCTGKSCIDESDESYDSDDSDDSDESHDSNESDDSNIANGSFMTTHDISNDSPHEVNIQNAVEVEPVQVEVEPVQVEVEPVQVEVKPTIVTDSLVELVEEVKQVKLETNEQNYESFTVKELKELVSAKGGKVTGKKKNDLIEYLLS